MVPKSRERTITNKTALFRNLKRLANSLFLKCPEAWHKFTAFAKIAVLYKAVKVT